MKKSDWARARAYLKAAYAIAPERKKIGRLLGVASYRLGLDFRAKKDLCRARGLLQEASSWLPDVANVWHALGRVSKDLGRKKDAERALRKSVALKPSAPALFALGHLLYEGRRYREAVTFLERAKQLDPDRRAITLLLARAQKDAKVEKGFSDHRSAHFLVRFHGERHGLERFVPEILRYLEKTWTALSASLRTRPRDRIVVIFYSKTEFGKLGRTRDWVQAYYDGKVRVPLDSWQSHKNRVQKTLRHELSHAFLYAVEERLTPWLHEGYAQWFAGERVDRARDAFRRRAFIQPELMRKPFMKIENAQVVARLYAQSLVLFAHLHEQQGMSGFRRVFQAIALGKGTHAQREEHALRKVYGKGLADLMRDVAAKHRLGKPRR